MRRLGVLLLVVIALIVVWVVPASAGPPERVEEPIFFIIPDTTNGLAVFVNINRADYCEWENGGFDGPPPAESLVPVKYKETGQGAIVSSFQGIVSVEMWELDDDAALESPCEDTDDALGPWATGEGRFAGNDNDFEASLTRTNSFGGRLQATVTDVDGHQWRYSASERAQIDRNDEFHVRSARTQLNKIGR